VWPAIRKRRRQRRLIHTGIVLVPVIAIVLTVTLLIDNGGGRQVVTVGPPTTPAGSPPAELVAAELQSGGTENITIISSATTQNVHTLVRGRVLYGVGGIAESSAGDVYFADYNSSGVSSVTTTGTIKLVASGGLLPAVSADDRYLSLYKGPLVSGGTGPGSSPVIEIINRTTGQSRDYDLSTPLGPGYIVRSLTWLASTDTLAVQAEILPAASQGPACFLKPSSVSTQACNQAAPAPIRPQLVLLDATSAPGPGQVFDIGHGWTLVGPGPKPGTAVVEVDQGNTAQLLTISVQDHALQQTLLARLPSGTTVQSVDTSGRHVLYLDGYALRYGTISREQITAIHPIPGRFVAATWTP
jgi:hypothetical protein